MALSTLADSCNILFDVKTETGINQQTLILIAVEKISNLFLPINLQSYGLTLVLLQGYWYCWYSMEKCRKTSLE